MPFDFTEAYKEAVASADQSIIFTDTLTITHPTFGADFRFARSEIDITLDGDLYLARQFAVTLPQVAAASSPGMQINVVDIDLAVASVLDAALETTVPVLIDFKTFMSSEPTAQAQFSASLEGTAIAYANRTLVVSASYPDIVNRAVPRNKYTANDFPGLRT